MPNVNASIHVQETDQVTVKRLITTEGYVLKLDSGLTSVFFPGDGRKLRELRDEIDRILRVAEDAIC